MIERLTGSQKISMPHTNEWDFESSIIFLKPKMNLPCRMNKNSLLKENKGLA